MCCSCRANTVRSAIFALTVLMSHCVLAQPRHGFGVDVNSLQVLRFDKVKIELRIDEKQKARIERIQQRTQERLQKLLSRLSKREVSPKEKRERARKLVNKSQQKVALLLNEAQRKRLQEIIVQVYKAFALRDKQIATQIGLSDCQYKKIVGYWNEHLEAIPKLFQAVRDGKIPPGKQREKRDELRKRTTDKLMSVLTDAQKKNFEKLKGKKFDLDLD